nr:hypothetical protein CFP56_39899 [Quercus suber]
MGTIYQKRTLPAVPASTHPHRSSVAITNPTRNSTLSNMPTNNNVATTCPTRSSVPSNNPANNSATITYPPRSSAPPNPSTSKRRKESITSDTLNASRNASRYKEVLRANESQASMHRPRGSTSGI